VALGGISGLCACLIGRAPFWVEMVFIATISVGMGAIWLGSVLDDPDEVEWWK
jgi:hypothetical protein